MPEPTSGRSPSRSTRSDMNGCDQPCPSCGTTEPHDLDGGHGMLGCPVPVSSAWCACHPKAGRVLTPRDERALAAYRACVEAGSTAMNGGHKDRHGRWTGETRTVLEAALPVLAEFVRQECEDKALMSQDFGRAVDPEFAADLIEDVKIVGDHS